MVTEIELKYSLLETSNTARSTQIKTVISQLLTEHDLTFVHQEKSLSNCYFDTPDFTLRKNRIALRTRGTKKGAENEHFEQTIKTSGKVIAGLHQRPEYNVDINNAKPLLALFPATIWPNNTDINQLQQQVIELFATNFTRNTWLVTIPNIQGNTQDNAQIEVAFDCGDIVCSGYQYKEPIHEVELEVVSGPTDALFGLTKLLFSKLALRPGQLTKAARGYALYRQSIDTSNICLEKSLPINTPPELPLIKLTSNESLKTALMEGLSTSLTQLQLRVDEYVATCANEANTSVQNESDALTARQITALQKIQTLLILLRHGFWIFEAELTERDEFIRKELSYFIGKFSWLDKVLNDQLFSHFLSHSLEKTEIDVVVGMNEAEKSLLEFTLESIITIDDDNDPYPDSAHTLSLLHSERFNQLQLSLLMLLLKNEHNSSELQQSNMAIVDFSAAQLTSYRNAVNSELANLFAKDKPYLITENKSAQVLLNRALLTICWLGSVFTDSESDIIKTYIAPWLDIKESVNKLQCVVALESRLQVMDAKALLEKPVEIEHITAWLTSLHDKCIIDLDQAVVNSAGMEPYWPETYCK
ncbi:inorganic triphosphatase [Colwellia echini]|uniref:CYTH domain-containing protein n=1 Tax=Colwellia echini TaxID=1982103 RepID=A0ABY3N1S0_9GAMM|nr:CYTH domain-containing protein [Colwellia echini]TYK67415.1 CYTH domain-containing protein [Colwellia echini]